MMIRRWKAVASDNSNKSTIWKQWSLGNELWETSIEDSQIQHMYRSSAVREENNSIMEILQVLPETPIPIEALLTAELPFLPIQGQEEQQAFQLGCWEVSQQYQPASQQSPLPPPRQQKQQQQHLKQNAPRVRPSQPYQQRQQHPAQSPLSPSQQTPSQRQQAPQQSSLQHNKRPSGEQVRVGMKGGQISQPLSLWMPNSHGRTQAPHRQQVSLHPHRVPLHAAQLKHQSSPQQKQAPVAPVSRPLVSRQPLHELSSSRPLFLPSDE